MPLPPPMKPIYTHTDTYAFVLTLSYYSKWPKDPRKLLTESVTPESVPTESVPAESVPTESVATDFVPTQMSSNLGSECRRPQSPETRNALAEQAQRVCVFKQSQEVWRAYTATDTYHVHSQQDAMKAISFLQQELATSRSDHQKLRQSYDVLALQFARMEAEVEMELEWSARMEAEAERELERSHTRLQTERSLCHCLRKQLGTTRRRQLIVDDNHNHRRRPDVSLSTTIPPIPTIPRQPFSISSNVEPLPLPPGTLSHINNLASVPCKWLVQLTLHKVNLVFGNEVFDVKGLFPVLTLVDQLDAPFDKGCVQTLGTTIFSKCKGRNTSAFDLWSGLECCVINIQRGLEAEEFVQVLAHELAHVLVHIHNTHPRMLRTTDAPAELKKDVEERLCRLMELMVAGYFGSDSDFSWNTISQQFAAGPLGGVSLADRRLSYLEQVKLNSYIETYVRGYRNVARLWERAETPCTTFNEVLQELVRTGSTL
ncbi:hypothetical protein DFS34DRAFT_597750 [Phlyctochytrium arcticum]|nr:hypothetical protein DFS34DRAFT_597750 [Phlyctochytrium arcticum]